MLKRICTQLENKENVKILKRKLFQKTKWGLLISRLVKNKDSRWS